MVSLSDVPLPAAEVDANTAKITHAMQKKTVLILDFGFWILDRLFTLSLFVVRLSLARSRWSLELSEITEI